jgi:hypothetical protein
MMRKRGYLHRREQKVPAELEGGTNAQHRNETISELPSEGQGPATEKRYKLDGGGTPAELEDETPPIAELDATGYARNYR